MGPKQEAALNHFTGRASLKVLLGPPSSGKSTLLRHYREGTKDAVILPISGPQKSALSVLSALLRAAELGPWNLAEIEQRNLLTVFVQQRSHQGKRIVLCIDNLSGFSAEAWSEIERLRLLELANKNIVELMIVGTETDAARSPLMELLHNSPTSAIEAVHFLAAPTDHDIAGYIDWRLAQFGIQNAFSESACRLINCLTQGRLSFVNILCQVVLMEQMREPADVIDPGMVQRAAAALAALRGNNAATADTLELKRLEAPVRSPAGRLVVSCNSKLVRTLDLNGRILIGRSRDNDLFLPSRYLSRHHAAILPTPDGRYYIVDLNSANGILVNGKIVTKSVLSNGDRVSVGQFRLKVELGAQPQQEAAPSPADTDRISLDETDLIPVVSAPLSEPFGAPPTTSNAAPTVQSASESSAEGEDLVPASNAAPSP
jgi:hypothetical protein